MIFTANLCVTNGGILKPSRPTGQMFCWKEGWYTRPQADDFCKRICGRLPIIHNMIDNEVVGGVAGSVSLLKAPIYNQMY